MNLISALGGNAAGHDDEADHTIFVWRGFVALSALVIFFLAEKMINMLGEWRERKRALHREKKVRVVRSGNMNRKSELSRVLANVLASFAKLIRCYVLSIYL